VSTIRPTPKPDGLPTDKPSSWYPPTWVSEATETKPPVIDIKNPTTTGVFISDVGYPVGYPFYYGPYVSPNIDPSNPTTPSSDPRPSKDIYNQPHFPCTYFPLPTTDTSTLTRENENVVLEDSWDKPFDQVIKEVTTKLNDDQYDSTYVTTY
jgi:hypothetical protein